MRALRRLNRVDSDDVNRTRREATVTIFQRETRLRHVERLDFVGDVNDGSRGQHGQNGAFYRRGIIILRTPIACYCDNCHRFKLPFWYQLNRNCKGILFISNPPLVFEKKY
jgi:hypothetical protein